MDSCVLLLSICRLYAELEHVNSLKIVSTLYAEDC